MLILAVRLDQDEERRGRQLEGANRRLELAHDRPRRLAVVAPCELALELVEQGAAIALGLVAEDVDEAAVAVDAAQVRAERAREEQRGDGEVLPTGAASDGCGVHAR